MDHKIVKFQEAAVISESQKLTYALTQSPMVCEAEVMQVDVALSAIIDKSIFYLGLNTPVGDRAMMKEIVLADVQAKFPRLTIDELVLYIDNGAHGKYGEVKGLAPKDIFNWLTAGSISQEKKDKVAELAKQSAPAPKPTNEQQAQMAWKNLLNAWATFKKEGSYNDFGNAVYKTLVDNGKINFSDEQIADFNRIAKADLMKQYNPLQHVGNVIKVNECKAIIAEIENGGNDNTRVKVNAKKLALNHFFRELSEMEMDITDLFAE